MGCGGGADRTAPFGVAGHGEQRRLAGATHQKVTLYNICSLEPNRTQPRHRHALHPHKRSVWHVVRVTCWRYQPSGAAPRGPGPLPQTARSYRSDTHNPPSLYSGPVWPIFPFAPVGITETLFFRAVVVYYYSFVIGRAVIKHTHTITTVPNTKLFEGRGTVEDMCHEIRRTGLCGLVCPSRTSERGGKGNCVKEGGGKEGECESV